MPFAVRNITLKLPEAPRFLFRDLSFDLPEPGFHALFGPSGVGKTTLARIIIGQLKPSRGEIDAVDRSVFLYSYNLERLPDWSSVGSHLESVTPPGRDARRRAMIQSFGLQECLDKRFSHLSLGQQNRINLLRYLLQDFDMLILDESLGNVDEPTREKILFEIKVMFPESYFLYISHNVVEVARFCRWIIVLRGSDRKPDLCRIAGQDIRNAAIPDTAELQRTMLEIVNASS